MRGERGSREIAEWINSGSSPHAWGTPAMKYVQATSLRFIPTCVGNAPGSIGRRIDCTVHPHMRGERSFETKPSMTDYGSSPHAWGTLVMALLKMLKARFIPTCVGNASINRISDLHPAVHPHMRGERGLAIKLTCTECGSSPHAWGTPCPLWNELI